MLVSRRELGMISLGSLVGLSGCLTEYDAEIPINVVNEAPDLIEQITLFPTQIKIEFDQISRDTQVQYVSLFVDSSEEYQDSGQLHSVEIGSGRSTENISLPSGFVKKYRPIVGDRLKLLLLTNGKLDCEPFYCEHSGGSLVDIVEFEVVER